ncbi:MAG TPA: TIGR03936 family radical SAM-associated protein [Egibacteraceae bacterium]|nr:TIGR03936 family radical SAM-associated protein [Egibacteraceae bacterium]
MRARVRYAKTGKLRFVSAIDLGRLWERALRKADLPIAYSEGFSPHPKVSFTDALPLGLASTGEYAELTFAAPVDLDAAIAALNAAFPEGLAVLAAAEAGDGAPRLARLLQAVCWDLFYPLGQAAALGSAVRSANAADVLVVGRERKGETVEVDLKPALHGMAAWEETVRVMVRHVEPPPRPSEVHLALNSFALHLPGPALALRVAQGQPAPDGLLEALSGEFVPLAPSMSLPRPKERATT